ncbi:threonine/serine exporter ThrE family protein [Porphyromonas sp. COT-239 OH1446]|uniref:threonine/serine ThrE exporter family protein n=1 Tax=Porphyromonas sp. COT-239 OH1446 TaxID=1515613 RepID=UPI00052DC510|nr:threonine/serine exporter family protein [Porphyromonas sp. COT-239 OH1446]KGN67673.1 hypothetical protein HQ37_07460 [Porphyromonas sp. COT-239 OH1446]
MHSPTAPQPEQEELIDFLLRFATVQTSVGVQTSRIVLNTTRIAEAYGYEANIMMFQRNIAMTLSSKSQGTKPLVCNHPITALTHHRARPLNFYLNAELSRLSWFAYDNRPSLAELEVRMQQILDHEPTNRWLILLLISLANMAFCRLFGGDLPAMLFTLLGTAAAFYLRQELNRRHAYHYLVVVVASFVASFVVGLGVCLGWTATPQIALSTSVLFLIPGVPFINSMMDFFDGYILNGISRLVNALLIVLSLSIGLSVSLLLLDLSLL